MSISKENLKQLLEDLDIYHPVEQFDDGPPFLTGEPPYITGQKLADLLAAMVSRINFLEKELEQKQNKPFVFD